MWSARRAAGRRRGARWVGVVALAPALFACSSGPGGGNGAAGPPGGAAAAASVAALALSINPADGATSVSPDVAVKVSAKHGRLTAVRVSGAGLKGAGEVALAGTMDKAGKAWRATGALMPASTYTVSAQGVDAAGKATTTTSTFTTEAMTAKHRLGIADIWPSDGTTVGIGQPIAVGFTHPVNVANRAAVQRALQVQSSPAVEGAWYWVDTNYVDFRPKTFWPTGTKITLKIDLAGVYAGDGLWGTSKRTSAVTVGRAQIIHVDLKKHVLSVESDGATLREFPISGGKPGWQTRNGTQVIMQRIRNKTWTNTAIDAPEAYTLHSAYAMRLTNSGEFIHDAPWNKGNIGSANTSHGCVGMYPKDMAWLYAHTIMGDPVIITGSHRPTGVLWNRYMDWNVPWSTWSAGNA
jgi:lipoprotein-anchoring transpeptidase ErfK/SrfK